MPGEEDWGPLEKARKALDPIWKECQASGFRGRCWGNKSTSDIPGSNIILCDGKTVVIVYSENGNRYDNLAMTVFYSDNISLSLRVFEILKANNLPINCSPAK